MNRRRAAQRLALASFALALAAAPTRATWSIVVVDRATNEVCVAGATCLNLQLEKTLPAVVPEVGVAAAQSLVDSDGSNLALIQEGLQAGLQPLEILAALAGVDAQHETRQYGIVTLAGVPATFTGALAGEAKFGVAGEVGSLVYAIQGNVLTGSEVVLAAEAALLTASGDLGQRAMAGMEAARALGGDGRCSCSFSDPTGCGVPPPSFTKTALSSFLIVARPGDQAGPCGTLLNVGCATGSYYLKIEDKGQTDSVLDLQVEYAAWRAAMAGVPDAYSSTLTVAGPLSSDGRSEALVTVQLADLDGVALTSGGQQLLVRRLDPPLAPPAAIADPVRDLGDGTHQFRLQATEHAGRASFRVVVIAGEHRVQLPDFHVFVAAPGAPR